MSENAGLCEALRPDTLFLTHRGSRTDRARRGVAW